MSAAEINEFLNRRNPAMLGVLGTLDSAGYPSSIPVWFRYDGRIITIWTTMARAWPKHILRHPKVSFAVMETAPPFAAVLVKGTASLESNGKGHWDEVRQITERYMPKYEVDDYIESWRELETMCSVQPERFISWKRGY